MRNISGFPNQPQPQARATNPSLASGRLPNGKLGTIEHDLVYGKVTGADKGDSLVQVPEETGISVF